MATTRTRTLFYFAPTTRGESPLIFCRAIGIHEVMKPGVIFHGGPGWADHIVMHFHSPALLDPGQAGEVDTGGRTIIWTPETYHHYGNMRASWDHSWMNIQGTVIADELRLNGIPVNTPISCNGGAIVDKFLRLLYDEIQGNRKPDEVILEAFTGMLCRELARAIQESDPLATIPPRLAAVRQFMESNLSQRIRLRELAGIANLSVTQFSVLFKRHFRVSPIEYVNRLRLRRASLLLASEHLAVFEVAAMVGFDDPLYFSRQFHRHFGMSPVRYRGMTLRKMPPTPRLTGQPTSS